MRRTRKDETKVWHNPELAPFARAPKNGGTNRNEEKGGHGHADKHHRAALEALFAPKSSSNANGGANGKSNNQETTPKPNRVVAAPAPRSSDPRDLERQKLLDKLLICHDTHNFDKRASGLAHNSKHCVSNCMFKPWANDTCPLRVVEFIHEVNNGACDKVFLFFSL